MVPVKNEENGENDIDCNKKKCAAHLVGAQVSSRATKDFLEMAAQFKMAAKLTLFSHSLKRIFFQFFFNFFIL
jgi:hypothetical protein